MLEVLESPGILQAEDQSLASLADGLHAVWSYCVGRNHEYNSYDEENILKILNRCVVHLSLL